MTLLPTDLFRRNVIGLLVTTATLAGLTINVPHTVGLTTLWGAAALTLITGWDYLRVGLKHMD